MSFTETEIASQPDCWRRAADLAADHAAALPDAGERVAVTGCGTSWFMAQAFAARREAAGAGETDAFPASELPPDRRYDRLVAICRSGTTTEVCELLARTDLPTTVVVGSADTQAAGMADRAIALPFADERSIVQTRFATTALALLRTSLGETLDDAVADARTALAAPLPVAPALLEQITFIGTGWTIGLAHEAALKLREAARFWTESYPAMEYRHGPVSITGPGRVVWAFGSVPAGLPEQIQGVGGDLVAPGLDPMAELVSAQRLAVALAELRGFDPDRPHNLTRSVVLP